ncbi:glycosyltransferase family 2 protein [Candidatus Binatia bacterium]|nr:glycosyltransferase family 2 protein [Candidatus Binatia bacterium]
MSTASQPADVELSVVVVSWNGAAYLGACLNAVRGAGRELIVVDNGSRDGSTALVRERHGDVRLLVNDANLGYARAANRGLRAAHGRYVLFLNPDAIVSEEAIAAARAVLDDRPGVGLVGVAQRGRNGSVIPTVEPFFSLAALRRPSHRRVSAPGGEGPVEIDWCHGAFFLGRREELLALGGYDERYFLYAEDMDLCFRVHESGKSVVYLPQVSILHEGNAAGSKLLGERRAAAIFASQLAFHRRVHGVAATALLRAVATLAFGARALAYRVSGSPLAERYAALAAVALRGGIAADAFLRPSAASAATMGKP